MLHIFQTKLSNAHTRVFKKWRRTIHLHTCWILVKSLNITSFFKMSFYPWRGWGNYISKICYLVLIHFSIVSLFSFLRCSRLGHFSLLSIDVKLAWRLESLDSKSEASCSSLQHFWYLGILLWCLGFRPPRLSQSPGGEGAGGASQPSPPPLSK